MLIYIYAIYLTLHNYNFFKIKQLREDKNKMENQEVLILEKIKNRKENPTQKIDKNKKERRQAKGRIVKINSTIK